MHKYPKVNSRLPHVEIDTDNGTVYLGRERFRHANDLLVDTTSVFAAGEYFMGQHTIKFGLDYKNKDTHNVFVESSLGRYEFDSIEDYAAGNYSRYVFRIGRDPNSTALKTTRLATIRVMFSALAAIPTTRIRRPIGNMP